MTRTSITDGIYPTMITPYTDDGKVDYEAVRRLTEWYWRKGCDGIFASCQSSEIFYLDIKDRVNLARCVKDMADELAKYDKGREPMTVVASGHISDSIADQVDELSRMADTGVDAIVLISNRVDIENTNNDSWICDAEKLIEQLPQDIPLGIYECPTPYKRILTPEMLKWCISTDRFAFFKDTCCDADLIGKRLEQIKGSKMKLFNANAQTLLETLRKGASGYCGVMANFHPELYSYLYRNFEHEPEKAELLQSFLCMSAFTEALLYPVTAKYHLNDLEGVKMKYTSRVHNSNELDEYNKSCIRQMKLFADWIAEEILDLEADFYAGLRNRSRIGSRIKD